MGSLWGKRVVVFGLARSGLSAIRLLQHLEAKVTAVDQAAPAALEGVARTLRAAGVTLHLGQDPTEVLAKADLVVVSPGVPLCLAPLQAAAAAGVAIIGEVELAFGHLRPALLLGITGTNGKSTTTALTGALLAASGRRVFVGGNLGLPLSEAALDATAFDAYVVELSSFQLEGARSLRCNGAAILNLSPDHLDRYPSPAAYGQAKARIFHNQADEDFAVVNADDPAVLRLAQGVRRRCAFTLGDPEGLPPALAAAAWPAKEGFALRLEGGEPERYELRSRALRGRHNAQNAMAAALLARRAGLCAPAQLQAGLDGFAGLPHRLESVAVVDGVEWVNDSKATNVESALVALQAFEGGLWLILGGKGKGAPYGPLVEASAGRVRGVLSIGEDAGAIEAAFDQVVPVHPCRELRTAVAQARRLASPGEVVLLSPACASYDQFKNFEHRGDVFKSMVRGLTA
jgi:UDP-N-acetylmuramoylalanine--D-glutamate ligase